jgi:riboflavin kinase / FMN adenylyltransferase
MEVFVGIDSIPRTLINPVLTIGNFDGVHRGHQSLFERVKDWASRLNGEAVVVTFDPHPLRVIRPGNGPVFITPHERKLQLIAASGIDVTVVVPFDRQFAQISATKFVTDLLVGKLGARAIVVGYDYRFGRGREGDITFLKNMGSELGFEVEAVSAIEIDGTMVSSTMIRQCIQAGELAEACRLLGRPYEISGTVVRGRNRGGRLLGFPTANIRIQEQAPPRRGVYVVEAAVGGRVYGGAANLGVNPTFGETELSLEVHLFDFDEIIYDQTITVRFLERLRDETRFAGVEELIVQIRKDCEKAKAFLEALGR